MLKSRSLAKLGLFATFVAVVAFFAFVYDPEYPSVPTVPGTVVTNIEQVSDNPRPEKEIQVRLPSGLVVNARVSVGRGYPFPPGATVPVTQYRSRLFGKRSYWVEARPTQP